MLYCDAMGDFAFSSNDAAMPRNAPRGSKFNVPYLFTDDAPPSFKYKVGKYEINTKFKTRTKIDWMYIRSKLL